MYTQLYQFQNLESECLQKLDEIRNLTCDFWVMSDPSVSNDHFKCVISGNAHAFQVKVLQKYL